VGKRGNSSTRRQSRQAKERIFAGKEKKRGSPRSLQRGASRKEKKVKSSHSLLAPEKKSKSSPSHEKEGMQLCRRLRTREREKGLAYQKIRSTFSRRRRNHYGQERKRGGRGLASSNRKRGGRGGESNSDPRGKEGVTCAIGEVPYSSTSKIFVVTTSRRRGTRRASKGGQEYLRAAGLWRGGEKEIESRVSGERMGTQFRLSGRKKSREPRGGGGSRSAMSREINFTREKRGKKIPMSILNASRKKKDVDLSSFGSRGKEKGGELHD